MLKSYWRSFLLSKRLVKDGIDIYHGLSNELPYNLQKTNVKSVVTIHDLIFMRYPEWYNPIDRQIYTYKFRYSSKIAQAVIAISEQTKTDLIDYFKMDEKKIKVVYQGCNEVFKQQLSKEEIEKLNRQYNLPEQYILYVGTIEERKNLLNIIRALHQGKIDVPLVVVGRPTAYYEKVRKYIQDNQLENIIFLNSIPVENLPAMYQGASLFTYPSIFEGFGIPILEALQSKVPVITSKGGCFHEVGGTSSVYIDPENVEEIIDAIKKILSDSALQVEMKEKGFQHAHKFSNTIISQQIMDLYQEILDAD
jgi:glycosyltransferase involved in cell wall biosynthesis